MSYLLLEVEIDHGKVITKEAAKLPEKGNGVLMILQPDGPRSSKLSQIEALEALQKHLKLDAAKADEWMSAVRDARR